MSSKIHLWLIVYEAIIFVLCFCNIKNKNETHDCQTITKSIDTVFVNHPRQDTVYFKSNNMLEVLTCSNDSVYWISQMIKNRQWVMLSRMPANPDEAYGQNERYDIYFVPAKKSITLEELGYNRTYSFLSLFEKDTEIFVELDNGEERDTINLTEFAKKNNYWMR